LSYICDKFNYTKQNIFYMSKVQHYKGINSNLEKIYSVIKDTINEENNLKIVSEYKGLLNGIPLRSIWPSTTLQRLLLAR
jgi:hypothetical protein